MSDLWFQHLSAALSGSGTVAYAWDAGADRFSWAGDVQGVLGLGSQDHPQSSARFHGLLNPQAVPQRLLALHELMNAGAGELRLTYGVRRSNGTQIEIEEIATLQFVDGVKTVNGFLKVRNAEQGVQHHASNAVLMTETMTPHNGRHVVRQKIEEWADTGASVAGQKSGYVLAVGIDRLTIMNEAFGARYADELIESTGTRLQKIAGAAAYVSRIDGDVFSVFFPQGAHSEMASVARQILNNFHNVPAETSKGPVGTSVSIGGACLDSAARRDAASMVTRAEMAMRAAKERGRGCFVSHSEAAGQMVDKRILLESGDEFLKAIRDDRVMLAFQPVMGTQSNSVTFHECLIRMMDEDGKIVTAGDFIPAVEKLGLSRLVDQYALRMAIRELSLFPDLTLSVNVSHMTLANPDWLRGLVNALRDKPSIAKRLIIEITETAMSHDSRHTMRVTRTLKELGCRIALDDFGAGYTAFSQIKDMSVDIVKIDKSFVRNMDEERNRLFIRTLQTLADGMNVETVGEGAETMADAKMLTGDGINHIQGYVYGFPEIERVWLPRDHSFRLIPLTQSGKKTEAREQALADLAAFQRA